MYRSLDSTKIVHTLEILERRVVERFPQASLSKVCAELTQIARENDERARMLARPNYLLRTLSAIVILAGLALIGWVATRLEVKRDAESIFSTLQGIDAGLNIVLVAGATVIFLVTLEARWKRQQALGDLEELRSIIHVIDMHQLTKDPERLRPDFPATDASPQLDLDADQLGRYLDYCAELLSLVGKGAALCAQESDDALVLDTVSEVETLTSDLARKIGQKIALLGDVA